MQEPEDIKAVARGPEGPAVPEDRSNGVLQADDYETTGTPFIDDANSHFGLPVGHRRVRGIRPLLNTLPAWYMRTITALLYMRNQRHSAAS